jgi:hypothetical protein
VHRSLRFSDAGRRFRRRSSRRAEPRLRFGPCPEHGPTFPDRMGSVERVILSLAAFEKVKLYKPCTLSGCLSRDVRTCSNAASDPLATRKWFIAISNKMTSCARCATPSCQGVRASRYRSARALARATFPLPVRSPNIAAAPHNNLPGGRCITATSMCSRAEGRFRFGPQMQSAGPKHPPRRRQNDRARRG